MRVRGGSYCSYCRIPFQEAAYCLWCCHWTFVAEISKDGYSLGSLFSKALTILTRTFCYLELVYSIVVTAYLQVYEPFLPFVTPFTTLAPFPAAADFVLPKTLPKNTRAVHGVAQTLNIILTGKRIFVMAYAVATSIKILLPISPACHFRSTLSISPAVPRFLVSGAVSCPSGSSIASLLNPNQPFLAKYRPNFDTPSEK